MYVVHCKAKTHPTLPPNHCRYRNTSLKKSGSITAVTLETHGQFMLSTSVPKEHSHDAIVFSKERETETSGAPHCALWRLYSSLMRQRTSTLFQVHVKKQHWRKHWCFCRLAFPTRRNKYRVVLAMHPARIPNDTSLSHANCRHGRHCDRSKTPARLCYEEKHSDQSTTGTSINPTLWVGRCEKDPHGKRVQ